MKPSNKTIRFSENFSYKKEGMDLEKSIRKLKPMRERDTFIFFPGQVSPKKGKNAYQSPEKTKKENKFNKLLLESEKHPSSKYLILGVADDDDNLSLVLLLSNIFLKKFL